MIVLDASAVIELLLQTPKASAVEQRLFARGSPSPAWHVPHLLDVEVAQVLRKHVASHTVSATRARQSLDDLLALPLIRYPHDWLLSRVWELRRNLTAYDAVYVALAEALQLPLLTCDTRIAAAPGHRARVDVV